MLVKEHSFGKVTGIQPAALPKSEIQYRYFQLICVHFRNTSQTSGRKRATLKFNVYYMLLKVYNFSFQLLQFVHLTDG